MNNYVYYYYLIQQCFGTHYFGDNARELANILGYKFKEFLLKKRTVVVSKKKFFTPDTLIVDDLKIIYPGTPEELYILYKLQGPLAGGEKYKQLAVNNPDNIKAVNLKINAFADICSSGMLKNNIADKMDWLKRKSIFTDGIGGFIAYENDEPVSVIEFISEDKCIYPIPEKRSNFLFINCIYNFPNLLYDYRPSLLKTLIMFASSKNYKGLSVISALNTCTPNGPLKFFEDLEFNKIEFLDQVLIKHFWEDLYFMEFSI